MSYIEKEKLIKADITSIENRVRHAFNQGYDLGFKDGKEKAKPLEQELCEDWYDVPSDEMTLGQARRAVKDLRKKLSEHLEQEPTTKNNVPDINVGKIEPITRNDCEHCSRTYGTLDCCTTISNKWGYSCKEGHEEYARGIKKLGSTTKNDLGVDCISRQAVIDKTGLSEWFDSSDSYNEFVFALNELPSVTPQEPRWIPVSEKLPEKNVWVLVTFKMANGENSVDIKRINQWEDEIDMAYNENIIAWMPLPKPYESQESEDKEW